MRSLRLATRPSALAMWQARWVATRLRRRWPGLRVRLVPVRSRGDIDRSTPLYGAGGAGFFTKEVQEAVLDGRADAAVHSCKDLPTAEHDLLAPPVVLPRHDPRDALVGARRLAELPPGARVGSSSLRRRAQLAALRPDLRFEDLRGNVPTRIARVHDGELDATILAYAGLARLGLLRRAGASPLDPREELIPSAAQGAVAVDCRREDRRSARLLAPIADHDSSVAVGVERAVLAGLRGGCSLPLGCYVWRSSARWRLRSRLSTDDDELIEIDVAGAAGDLADRALEQLTRGDVHVTDAAHA